MRIERFSQAYGTELPVVSAGMAMVGGPALVSAVCRAGGLGILGTGPMPIERLRAEIAAVRARTPRPFGINLIVEDTALGPATSEAHIELCAAERISPVVFFWKRPLESWVQTLRGAGAKLWATCNSVDEARQAQVEGFDAIMMQSQEAGGHVRATLGMFTLLPATRDAVGDMMIIAAGGIADGRTAAAAFVLGADAICLGTRLVASEEAAAHAAYKLALVEAQASDTEVTRIFGPEWPDAPMRVVRNRAVREAGEHPRSGASIGRTVLFGHTYEMPIHSAILPTLETRGDFDQMCMAAGTGVQFIHAVRPAGDLVREIAAQALALLS